MKCPYCNEKMEYSSFSQVIECFNEKCFMYPIYNGKNNLYKFSIFETSNISKKYIYTFPISLKKLNEINYNTLPDFISSTSYNKCQIYISDFKSDVLFTTIDYIDLDVNHTWKTVIAIKNQIKRLLKVKSFI